MGFFDFFSKTSDSESDNLFPISQDSSEFMGSVGSSFTYAPVYTASFDGQRFDGELGSIKDYDIDNEALMLRGWQTFIESDIAQMIIGKYLTWVIGEGMKMQSVPVNNILDLSNYSYDTAKFSKEFEGRFQLWKSTPTSSWSGEQSINELSKFAF